MLGTIVNTLAIIVGGLIGLIFRGGIPDKYHTTVIYGVGLAVILMGLKGALLSSEILLMIISMAAGSAIGELLRLEDRLEAIGQWLEKKMAGTSGDVAQGFITSSLLFCIGPMSILGALEGGLRGNHQTLFAKSVLDGIGAIVFASTFGIGALFSSAAVLAYQGTIVLTATFVRRFLVADVVNEMSAVGGLLIVAIAFNMLAIKKIRVANMLPAIFIPLIYLTLKRLVGS